MKKELKRVVAIVLVFSLFAGIGGVLKTGLNSKAAEAIDNGAVEIGQVVNGSINTVDSEVIEAYAFTTNREKAFYSLSFTSSTNSPCFGISSDMMSANYITYNYGTGSIDFGNTLKPNTMYYVIIKSYHEVTYSFKINEYKDDVGDDYSSCKKMTLGQVYNGRIENDADVDCYSFVAGNSKHEISMSGSENVRAQLYKDELMTVEIGWSVYCGNAGVYSNLESGRTYYIGVNGNTHSFIAEEYKICVRDMNSSSTTPAATPAPTASPSATAPPAPTSSPEPTVSPEPTDSADPVIEVTVPDVEKVNIQPSSKKVTLKWKQANGATGYQIVRSLKKKKGYKTIKRINKGSTVFFTDKKVESGKTYYYKIRAFRKTGNTITFGGWSPIKKVKVK